MVLPSKTEIGSGLDHGLNLLVSFQGRRVVLVYGMSAGRRLAPVTKL